MPSVFDPDDSLVVELRTYISVALCNERKRGININIGNCLCGLLNFCDVGGNLLAEPVKLLVFQIIQLILCAKDSGLQVLELRRCIALASYKRLLPFKIIRHEILKGIGYLEEIAEHIVVLDLQVLDSGGFANLLLHLRKKLAAAGLRFAEGIDVRVVAFLDDAALFHCKRRIVIDRLIQAAHQFIEIPKILTDPDQLRGRKALQNLADRPHHAKRFPECNKIPGIGASIADLGKQTLKIIDRTQILTHFIPVHIIVLEFLQSIKALPDFFLINERLLQKLVKKSCAHRCFGFIKDPKKRAVNLFLTKGLRQLKIAPGRGVQQHILAGQVGINPCDVGQIVHLRIIKIAKQRPAGRQSRLQIVNAKSQKARYAEMLQQNLSAVIFSKIMGIQRIDDNGKAVSEILNVNAAHHKGFVADNLRGKVFLNFVQNFLDSRDLCGIKVTG